MLLVLGSYKEGRGIWWEISPGIVSLLSWCCVYVLTLPSDCFHLHLFNNLPAHLFSSVIQALGVCIVLISPGLFARFVNVVSCYCVKPLLLTSLPAC